MAALNALGFRIKNSNEANGSIEAEKDISVRSWGEKIKITVTSSNAGSQVNVESRSAYSLQAVDWGKNKENVQRILTDLDNRVATSSSTPPPPPPPPPPSP
jgi:hypothetical protein